VTTQEQEYFDVPDWYVRKDGQALGPVDLDGLRDIVAAGHARGATLVRRSGDTDWTLLNSVIPDWERLAAADLEVDLGAMDDPALRVFRLNGWVGVIEEIVWQAGVYLLAFIIFRRMDPIALAALLGASVLGGFVHANSECIELGSRTLRRMRRGREVQRIALADIERSVPGLERTDFASLMGRKVIRSMDGAKFTLNRRAFRDDDYAALMALLRLDPY